VAALREAYERYCNAIGERSLSAVALGRRLKKRGISSEARAGTRFYVGVTLS
jgi:hypothetical protein